MIKRRRTAALALTGVLTLMSLTGCGSQANTGAASEPVTAEVSEAADTEAQADTDNAGALVIAEQGMFSAGGTVITSDGTFDVENYYTSREGSSSHVDHANVFYQIPEEETGLPMVFLHGYGQSRMGWMTTPDGRERWSDLFLRKGHSVWLIDQPRRGEAGQTSVAGTITTEPSDQTWYTQFRIGTYRDDAFTYNEGSQFPEGEDVLDQFFRQMTPDTGMDSANGDQNIDNTVVAQAVAAAIDEIYERTGRDSILVTHSQGGMPGWETARYTDHIAAIVAIEPGMAPQVDSEDYNALLEKKIPVTFYYGDYIGEEFTDVPAGGMWAMMASTADAFTEAYTAAGGISTIVHLPEEGITGNSHFMFQELNNDVIADHVEAWIQQTDEQLRIQQADERLRQTDEQLRSSGSNVLIAYFSVPEDIDTTDAIASASIVVRDGEKLGNTEYVAGLIQQTIGGDLFRIETVEDYPLDHDPLVDQAAEEQDADVRPELANHVENFEQYEYVFLGYPNWLAYHNLIQCTQA